MVTVWGIVSLAAATLLAAWHRPDVAAFSELAKTVIPAALSSLAFCLGHSRRD